MKIGIPADLETVAFLFANRIGFLFKRPHETQCVFRTHSYKIPDWKSA